MSYVSAAWGVGTGALAVAAGVAAHSTALVGTGAEVLADLVSTVVLIWRFRAERAGQHAPARVEGRAQLVSSSCLLLVATGLLITATIRLGADQGAEPDPLAVGVAAASVLVLPVLSWVKYRVAAAVPSRALRTDAHIGVVGATTAALTLLGLIATSVLGWTSADPVAAILVAVVAGVTGANGLRTQRP